jgi:large subunit ribosomal protein L24
MSKWLRKGDKVIIISGNDKGRTGEVLSRSIKKILVQGINVRKKHMKRRSQEQQSRIVDIEMPIHVSNVRFCTESGRPVKLFVKYSEQGKELAYRENGSEKSHRFIKKYEKK